MSKRTQDLIQDGILPDGTPQEKLQEHIGLHHHELLELAQERLSHMYCDELAAIATIVLGKRIKYDGTLGNCGDVTYRIEGFTPTQKVEMSKKYGKMFAVEPRGEFGSQQPKPAPITVQVTV